MCRNNDRDKKQREETKIQLKTNPIMCGKFEMKQAEKEKWLGQQISAGHRYIKQLFLVLGTRLAQFERYCSVDKCVLDGPLDTHI